MRNLVVSLVEHERISTTLAKAKELRRWTEKAITLGKRGGLSDRRLLLSRIPNKDTVAKVFAELAPRFKERNGGYTRIYRLNRRPGDNAEMALIEFVDYAGKPVSKDTKQKADKAKKALASGAKEAKKEAKAKETPAKAEKKEAKRPAKAKATSGKTAKKKAE